MRRREVITALGGGLALGACTSPGEHIIGFLGPLSGRRADLGEGGRNGALLAVALTNARGGINGRPLRLSVENDRLDPALARAGFERLRAQGMLALVGAYTKPVCDAVAPLAAAAGVPIVSPNLALASASTTPHLVFRLNRTARQNAEAYARRLTQAGQRHITLICETSSEEFVLSWVAHFQAAAAAIGGQPGHQVRYISRPETRFGALVDEALDARGDGFLLIAPTVDVARLCQQLRRRSPGLPIAAIDRSGNASLLQLGGRAVEGLVLLQAFDPDGPHPAFREFVTAYRSRFGEAPGQSAVLAHDAVALVSQTLQRRGRSSASMGESISGLGPIPGLQQPIAFDAQGLAPRQAWFVEVRNARFVTTGAA